MNTLAVSVASVTNTAAVATIVTAGKPATGERHANDMNLAIALNLAIGTNYAIGTNLVIAGVIATGMSLVIVLNRATDASVSSPVKNGDAGTALNRVKIAAVKIVTVKTDGTTVATAMIVTTDVKADATRGAAMSTVTHLRHAAVKSVVQTGSIAPVVTIGRSARIAHAAMIAHAETSAAG